MHFTALKKLLSKHIHSLHLKKRLSVKSQVNLIHVLQKVVALELLNHQTKFDMLQRLMSSLIHLKYQTLYRRL